jgi:tetratricopeptide (TPR) repeat protein
MSETTLPVLYLAIFLVLLGASAWFIVRQVLRTRTTESRLTVLQRKLNKETGTSQEHYELASILLDKKLFSQAITCLQKSLKLAEDEVPENLALVYNALGFAYAAQDQFDLAIRNYKTALEQMPNYVTALNNLGFAYEQKQLTKQALDIYEQALKIEPNDDVAKRRAASLRKRFTPA